MVMYNQILVIGYCLIAISLCGLKSVTSSPTSKIDLADNPIHLSAAIGNSTPTSKNNQFELDQAKRNFMNSTSFIITPDFYKPDKGFPMQFKKETKTLTSRINIFITLLIPSLERRFKRSLPSAKNNNVGLQLIKFESAMRDLKENINKMNETIKELQSSAMTSTLDKINFIDLKDALKNLTSKLDQLTNNRIQINGNVEQFMTDIINMIGTYTADLDNMNKRIQQIVLEREKKQLIDKCIKNIKNKQFEEVQKDLMQMNGFDLHGLVQKIYNKQEDNFDIVLNFADNIVLIPQNFFIYSGLSFEMDNNGHNNPFRLIQLVESLRRKVIDQFLYSNTTFENEAELLATDLVKKIKMETTNILKDSMLSGQRHLSDELANEIVSLQYGLFKIIIVDSVHDVFNKTGAEKLISYIKSYTYYEQIISGFTAVYNEMPKNDPWLFQLAADLINLTGYNPKQNPATLADYETLRNSIPKFVMSMMSSSKVYITNAIYDEYLFATEYKFCDRKHYSFTWISGKLTDPSTWENYKWIFEHEKDNIFSIKNAKSLEYLQASSQIPHNNCRQVVLSMDNSVEPSTTKWKVILEGNNTVQLKNVGVNEYLFAASHIFYDSSQRYVFTYTDGERTLDSSWIIES